MLDSNSTTQIKLLVVIAKSMQLSLVGCFLGSLLYGDGHGGHVVQRGSDGSGLLGGFSIAQFADLETNGLAFHFV